MPLLAIATVTFSCNNTDNKSGTATNSSSSGSPFANESQLPYQAPDFENIKDGDFQPALEEGMKIQLAEVTKIANNSASPTFENTLVAMEKSGQMLTRVNAVFNLLAGANTNPVLQQLQEDIAPKLAAHQDAIYLNPKLFKRVESIYNDRTKLKLDAESTHLIEYYYQQFEIAGAKLSEADKSELKN